MCALIHSLAHSPTSPHPRTHLPTFFYTFLYPFSCRTLIGSSQGSSWSSRESRASAWLPCERMWRFSRATNSLTTRCSLGCTTDHHLATPSASVPPYTRSLHELFHVHSRIHSVPLTISRLLCPTCSLLLTQFYPHIFLVSSTRARPGTTLHPRSLPARGCSSRSQTARLFTTVSSTF